MRVSYPTVSSGWRMLRWSVARGKKTSSGRPLIVYWPVPGSSVTRAIAVLRLPVAR
jgi:hypothetical protein